jgi:hypothetical protein
MIKLNYHINTRLSNQLLFFRGRLNELLLQGACVCELEKMDFYSNNFYCDSSVLKATFQSAEGGLKHSTMSANLRKRLDWNEEIRCQPGSLVVDILLIFSR